ncbi:MAG: cupin domain-containing protein [Solirubrobacteraceae bacterium]|nr:cupin domain-containing protein [Solirubrobacteraceae bacterium]
MADWTKAARTDATDHMAAYPGYGEARSYTDALGAEQVALTLRSMPPGTGGRGSYGHRHERQEELYLVVAGTLTAKVGDDVIELGPGDALRVAASAFRSIHNDGDTEAQVIICSVRDDEEGEPELQPDFWPA